MHQPSMQSPPTAAFTIEVRPDRRRVVVAPSGELDLATCDALEREVGELLDRGFAAITLDLRDLTFIDSSGLKLLIRTDQRAREDGIAFDLIDGDGPVRRLLDLTRMRERFTIAER